MAHEFAMFVGIGGFAFILWLSGTYDKYPEIALPFFVLAMMVMILVTHTGQEEFKLHWKELNKQRRRLVAKSGATEDERYKINEEIIKIGDEMEKLTLYNTPLMLGHLDKFEEKLNGRLSELYREIYRVQKVLTPHEDDDLKPF